MTIEYQQVVLINYFQTNRLARDTTGWYNIVYALDAQHSNEVIGLNYMSMVCKNLLVQYNHQ